MGSLSTSKKLVLFLGGIFLRFRWSPPFRLYSFIFLLVTEDVPNGAPGFFRQPPARAFLAPANWHSLIGYPRNVGLFWLIFGWWPRFVHFPLTSFLSVVGSGWSAPARRRLFTVSGYSHAYLFFVTPPPLFYPLVFFLFHLSHCGDPPRKCGIRCFCLPFVPSWALDLRCGRIITIYLALFCFTSSKIYTPGSDIRLSPCVFSLRGGVRSILLFVSVSGGHPKVLIFFSRRLKTVQNIPSLLSGKLSN